MLNTLSVILTIIILIVVSLIFIVTYIFQNSVEQNLNTTSSELSLIFSGFQSDSSTSFTASARDYVENFDKKEEMEVLVINSSGRVVMTSTGFTPDDNEQIPDFNDALSNENGCAYWNGKLSSNESAMSLTRIITNENGTCVGAVRYIVSMEQVNTAIVLVSAAVIACGLVIIALVILSGLMFIRSIVTPIRKLSEISSKIAHGDFSQAKKIEYKYDDEIGDLCDAISDMALDLQTADQMKNDFISRVSHELRTPLTAIKGWAETMQLSERGKLDRKTFDRGMGVIISESSRLTSIVEELLDFSRIQSGRMKLIKEKLDILAEFDDAVYFLKERAVTEGKHLLYDEPEVVYPAVYGDKNRLKQVFLNVLDNALKYTPKGGVVAAQVIYSKDEPDIIKIVITDTGCGISAEDLPKVKEKFYKANQTVGGSGIGLAVADEIMNLHNGSLDIESGEGVGTTVTLTFPVYKEGSENSLPENIKL